MAQRGCARDEFDWIFPTPNPIQTTDRSRLVPMSAKEKKKIKNWTPAVMNGPFGQELDDR
jgi:hypothetical protein